MSRHIYRAWDKEEQEMFEPCTENNNESFFAGFHNGLLKVAESQYDEESRYVLMQSVGIRDNFETLLYEQDIVLVSFMLVEHIPSFKAIIEWDKYRFALRNLDINSPSFQQPSLQSAFLMTPYVNLNPFGLSLTRIGDSFRNPELLRM